MKKIFNQNQSPKIKRTPFDLSHERKLSMGMGTLTPVLVQEVVPGDTFNINTQSMIRFSPLVAPTMHRINSYIHYFYVPNRIIWKGWEDFITGTTLSSIPTTRIQEVQVGSLADHLGVPTGDFTTGFGMVQNLPFRAYFKIWNDYYRDENLEAAIDIEDQTVNDNYVITDMKRRSWEKDYFTSALPWAQKGNPVTMDTQINYKNAFVNDGTITPLTPGGALEVGAHAYDENNFIIQHGNTDPLYLENIQSITLAVEELRRATRLQRWMERNARAGSRYVEHLLAHWGVKSSDSRLQRPEYIGGGKAPCVISEVLNTTGTPTAPQGEMAGHGISVGQSNQANKYCEEHGYIIGIMSVMPEPTYQQGLPRHLSRLTPTDFYFPEFAQLGEQEVLNQEIYFQGTDHGLVQDIGTFGYQSRYAEYKYNQSTVHGLFKTDFDFWHMGRKFANLPTLNHAFINCQPTKRIFAVTDQEEELYVQLYHQITAIRPMPYFNDPKL